MNKVVVTGIGCVTPVGNNHAEFSESLRNGKSGAGLISKFDTANFPVKKAFEVRSFSPTTSSKIHDPFIQYGLTASNEAVRDSRLDIPSMDPYRVGIAVSSSKGGMTTLERFRDRFMKHPSALLGARIYANTVPNILSQWIARKWKIKGPAKPAVAACATGTYAIIEGIRMIEDDEVDVCIAGASDASITKLMLAGYHKMGVLSSTDVSPFDQNRTGFLIGEGAGIVILEKEEHAKSRNARIYGRILSHAYGNECKNLISFPAEGDGLSSTLKRVVKNAKVVPADIGSLQLHGTATAAGDLYETVQIKNAFGRHAFQIPMSAIKSMIGHTAGASGALSFIANLFSLRDSIVHPTINLNSPDAQCDLNYTPNRSEYRKVDVAGSISMGFGGHIGAILVGK